ncbi:surface lipoprotein assembly modifier [Alteromonas sp. AMM-1]|uniref:surface lipoprotein assembly modifier n=1 Tax=Alteromonas sp. AMM-1 TaxID=3394233 RepID=UPI0039A593A1
MKNLIPITTVALISVPVMASVTYKGELKAGAQYDSNVTVNELDRASNQSDYAGYLKGRFSAEWQATDALSFNVGVNHQRTYYQDATDFNLAITTLNVGAGWQTRVGKWGVHSYLAEAALAGSDFMQYQQSGVSWQNSIAANNFMHVSADYLQKRFDTLPERNAKGGQLSTQWFYLPGKEGEMINVGYTYQYEDADTDRLDFIGHTGQVSWTYPTQLWGAPTSLKAQYQFVYRNYSEAEEFLSVTQRTDRQHTLGLTVSYELTAHVALDVGAKYADYQSNLIIADYQENQANVGFTARF